MNICLSWQMKSKTGRMLTERRFPTFSNPINFLGKKKLFDHANPLRKWDKRIEYSQLLQVGPRVKSMPEAFPSSHNRKISESNPERSSAIPAWWPARLIPCSWRGSEQNKNCRRIHKTTTQAVTWHGNPPTIPSGEGPAPRSAKWKVRTSLMMGLCGRYPSATLWEITDWQKLSLSTWPVLRIQTYGHSNKHIPC